MQPPDGERAFLTHWRRWAEDALPLPVCRELDGHEYQFGETKHRFDFAWPAQRLAIEIDGGQYAPGGGRHARDSDRHKMNLAAVAGWRVMHYSPQMLEADPIQCVEQVEAALRFGETI